MKFSFSLGFGISGIISEANEAYEQKDEEKAFVLYERYISLWFHIKESKEYTYLFVSVVIILSVFLYLSLLLLEICMYAMQRQTI